MIFSLIKTLNVAFEHLITSQFNTNLDFTKCCFLKCLCFILYLNYSLVIVFVFSPFKYAHVTRLLHQYVITSLWCKFWFWYSWERYRSKVDGQHTHIFWYILLIALSHTDDRTRQKTLNYCPSLLNIISKHPLVTWFYPAND